MNPGNALKRLGIIIVTYQNERHIGPLLTSLAATVDPARTFIRVLDNASTDATVAVFERESQGLGLSLRLTRSERNLGFARANNEAYATLQTETPSEIVILLNPDTVVHDGWWQPLLAELEKPGVGTATPLLLLPDGTVNARGNTLHFLGLGFVLGYGEKADAPPGADTPLFFGSGAALAFRTEVLDAMNAKLGLSGIFWEELFLYAEDSDFGWRLRMAGLEPRLVATSRVMHDHRFWLQPLDAPGERLFQIERNRYLLMLANFKVPTLVLLLPWIFASELALALGLWKLYPHRLRLWRAVASEAGRAVGDRAILRAMTGSIRHGALPFRTVDRLLDAGLRWSHRLLCFVVWW
jgi:GT2 family glycosyltransferase